MKNATERWKMSSFIVLSCQKTLGLPSNTLFLRKPVRECRKGIVLYRKASLHKAFHVQRYCSFVGRTTEEEEGLVYKVAPSSTAGRLVAFCLMLLCLWRSERPCLHGGECPQPAEIAMASAERKGKTTAPFLCRIREPISLLLRRFNIVQRVFDIYRYRKVLVQHENRLVLIRDVAMH